MTILTTNAVGQPAQPCSRCGALIDWAFTDAHDEWHRSLGWGK